MPERSTLCLYLRIDLYRRSSAGSEGPGLDTQREPCPRSPRDGYGVPVPMQESGDDLGKCFGGGVDGRFGVR